MNHYTFIEAWSKFCSQNPHSASLVSRVRGLLYSFDIYNDTPVEKVLDLDPSVVRRRRNVGDKSLAIYFSFVDWLKKQNENGQILKDIILKEIISQQRYFIDVYSDIMANPDKDGNRTINCASLRNYGNLREQCVANLIELLKLKGGKESE